MMALRQPEDQSSREMADIPVHLKRRVRKTRLEDEPYRFQESLSRSGNFQHGSFAMERYLLDVRDRVPWRSVFPARRWTSGIQDSRIELSLDSPSPRRESQ